MPSKHRDYQAEYRRRIERALAGGLSRSQARGHPTIKEAYASKRPPKPLDDARLQAGLSLIRQEKGIAETARQLGVSPERLRHELIRLGAIEKRGRRVALKDSLQREVQLFSEGRSKTIIVPGAKEARLVGTYMNQVNHALNENDPAYLIPYAGLSVTDRHGVSHPFETNLNTLYRLDQTGPDSFEQIYRYVV